LRLAHYSQEDNEVFHVASAVEEVLYLLDYETKRNGVIAVCEEKTAGNQILGNEADFKMIVLNLAQNALKAMPSGGCLRVDISKDKNNVFVEVKDTGIGIPKRDQPRVFERFYRVDKSHSRKIGGTGLGLSIVKHGALYHGGTVTLTSTEGDGTKIVITL
jgi:two-component system phosphate regulon sensor histidine kinase PhoR